MKKIFVILIIFGAFLLTHLTITFAQTEPDALSIPPKPKIKFASSPNPVGSGARALGMGGAFIAVADDATAASWNPAGLVHTDMTRSLSHISFVYAGFHRIEDNTFRSQPGADGKQSVTEGDINYFSITYPFSLFERYMAVSLNYQHLYDFTRDWNFSFTDESTGQMGEKIIVDDKVDYQQTGALSALGLAFAVKPFKAKPLFSAGVTLNLWDDSLNNEWEENTRVQSFRELILPDGTHIPGDFEYHKKDKYSFDGINANIGMLCGWDDLWDDHADDRLRIGLILKLPFKADVNHESDQSNMIIDPDGNKIEMPDNIGYLNTDEKLEMPVSYGIGLSYRFPNKLNPLRLSLDAYRTHWEDFILTDSEGKETSPITDMSPEKSDIKTTTQIRFGAEYRLYPKSQYVVPVRFGMFYDPAPTRGGYDEYYGISLGFGIADKKRFAFDIAYQFRRGDDVGTSLAPDSSITQDVREHTMYSSFIIYLF